MQLMLMRERLAVARLPAAADLPAWARAPSAFSSVTRTAGELSIITAEHHVPDSVDAERGWRALRVEGPLAFDQVGVLAALAAPLAAGRVSILAIATYDTDFVLVRGGDLVTAREALERAGHTVRDDG